MEELNEKIVGGEAQDAFLKKVKEYIDKKGQPDLSNYATKSWVSGQYISMGKIWKGTQAQYEALSKYDSDTIYFIEEE